MRIAGGGTKNLPVDLCRFLLVTGCKAVGRSFWARVTQSSPSSSRVSFVTADVGNSFGSPSGRTSHTSPCNALKRSNKFLLVVTNFFLFAACYPVGRSSYVHHGCRWCLPLRIVELCSLACSLCSRCSWLVSLHLVILVQKHKRAPLPDTRRHHRPPQTTHHSCCRHRLTWAGIGSLGRIGGTSISGPSRDLRIGIGRSSEREPQTGVTDGGS